MTEQLSGCEASKVFDEPVKTIVGCVATLVPEGPARTLLYVVVGLCAALAPFIYKYYLGVLAQGAAAGGSIERQDFDALRASLAGGNLVAWLYAKWLTVFLDRIERFFGDAGMADRTLFPHAFGLKTPAPLWTAPAFDRCLQLALLYPIATIFLIWAASGESGPAGSALDLPHYWGWETNLPWLRRGFAVVAFSTVMFEYYRFSLSENRLVKIRWVVFAGLTTLAVIFSHKVFIDPEQGHLVFNVGFVVLFVSIPIVAAIYRWRMGVGTPDCVDIAGAIAFAFLVFMVGGFFPGGFSLASACAIVVIANSYVGEAPAGAPSCVTAVVFAISFIHYWTRDTILFVAAWIAVICAFGAAFVIADASIRSIREDREGSFLAVFFVSLIVVCLGAAHLMPSQSRAWEMGGALLLFFGLFTLLNAPFDWASLGLTRALLRRGLELGGWWPYLLALVDAALAAIIIALLALF